MDAKITLKIHIKSHIKTNPGMFRNTKEPSSGDEHLCLTKVTCGSMVLVHVNPVSIVGAYISCFVCVYGSHSDPYIHTHTHTHTHTHSLYRV